MASCQRSRKSWPTEALDVPALNAYDRYSIAQQDSWQPCETGGWQRQQIEGTGQRLVRRGQNLHAFVALALGCASWLADLTVDRVSAFGIDLEHCPNCGGELKIIAAIVEEPIIEKILTHLRLQPGRPRARQPVGRSCKRPDRLEPSPFRRPQASCGDRLPELGASGFLTSLVCVAGCDAPTPAVPEPGSWVLLLAGLGGVGSVARARHGRATRPARG